MSRKVTLIQKSLLSDVTEAINEHNEYSSYNLSIDVAVYYLSLFNSLPSYHRHEEEEIENEVRLDSQLLKKMNGNYKRYLNFLIYDKFILLVKDYGADTKQSKTFKLSDKYIGDELICYEIEDVWLLKKFNNIGLDEIQQQKVEYCQERRPQLVKFFNEYLSIDLVKAKEIIEPYKLTDYERYKRAKQLTMEFYLQQWQNSIKPQTDFRLHSNLTRLNRALRRALRYKGKRLIALDIKSSQPYFFVVLLKAILKKDKKLLYKVGADRVLSSKNIDDLLALSINRQEVIDFAVTVTQKDIYTDFSKHLNISYNEQGEPIRKVSNFTNKNKGKKFKESHKIKPYKNERDLAKKVIMEIFFSSHLTTITEAKVFRQTYPSVAKVMRYIKSKGIAFDRLLTNIEAHCLLDVVAKEFHKKYPKVPLWSVHDSLVTTEDNLKLLEQEVPRLLKKTTTVQPQYEIEKWF